MTDNDDSMTVPMLLALFPDFLVHDIVDDDGFRDSVDLKLTGTLTLNGGAISFERPVFFDAVRTLYRDGLDEIQVEEESGRNWTLHAGERDSRKVLAITSDQDRRELHGFVALHPDPAARLAEFEAALVFGGLPADALPDWRARLAERALDNEEVRHLEAALTHTPATIARELERQLGGPSGRTETLVPRDRDYYENMIGAGLATSLPDLVERITNPHIARLLQVEGGPRQALLLGAHSSIITGSALIGLPEQEMADLLRWACDKGDVLSRVAAIEMGLFALERLPGLADPLIPLIESLRDLDPLDESGRLHLLMACALYVGGELSRLKLLADLPPFQRRLATFGQAALFERQAFGRLGVAHFEKWAIGQRARSFYYQGLVDLRVEPRWSPDYAGPEQLKAEFIGRIHNSATSVTAAIPEGPLQELLFGDHPGSIQQNLIIPASFLPGPLEGSTNGQSVPLPEEWEQILDDTLADAAFKPASVAALINLRGLFTIGSERVERAVDLIKGAGHRLDPDVDQDTRHTLFNGLAGLAGATRNPTLADELRIMVRKNRIDGANPPPPQREFMIAIVAAAAYEDLAGWTDFIGKWGSELAFNIEDKTEADALLSDMELLSLIEPGLRRTLGSPMAALEAFIGTAT